MKPRITYPRTVVLPKDCEQLWLQVKEDKPYQSFNGWISMCIRVAVSETAAHKTLDNISDEA